MSNGKAGGQPGNKNGSRQKPWANALNRAIAQRDGDLLREIAEVVLNQALAGDLQAIKEIADRLDGKPAQSITGNDGGPLELIARIERAIVDPHDTDAKGV